MSKKSKGSAGDKLEHNEQMKILWSCYLLSYSKYSDLVSRQICQSTEDRPNERKWTYDSVV